MTASSPLLKSSTYNVGNYCHFSENVPLVVWEEEIEEIHQTILKREEEGQGKKTTEKVCFG